MTLKIGDEVRVVASDGELRQHSCDTRIKTGGVYVISHALSREGGYYLADCGFCNHVDAIMVEPVNQYEDEDWV